MLEISLMPANVNVRLQTHGKPFRIDSNCNEKLAKDFKMLDS